MGYAIYIADISDEFADIADDFMDEWVTTKEATNIKKVGLSQHRIADLARRGKIVAERRGIKNWFVKVMLNNGKYDVVYTQRKMVEAEGSIEAKPPNPSPALSPPPPTFNIGDLKIAPSPIGTKLVSIGPPMFFPEPPLPAYADTSIRLHVENPSDASITISGISYKVTINGNYAGTGSAPGVYTISPHSKLEIDSPFRADFHTGGSVVISAIMGKELQIGLTGTAHYQSNSHSADKPFGGVISVTLQLPYHIS